MSSQVYPMNNAPATDYSDQQPVPPVYQGYGADGQVDYNSNYTFDLIQEILNE
jgi:hypothetical protein